MTSTAPLLTSEKITLLLSCIPFLVDHGPTPVTELAEHFSVDPPTVRSLIRFLGTAGIPGETATYQHEDLFDIDWDALENDDVVVLVRTVVVDDVPRFSPREIAALLAGLQYLRSVPELADEAEAAALMQKLTNVSAKHPPRIDVHAEPIPESLNAIRAALRTGNAVEFGYRDTAGTDTVRRVAPHKLESVDTLWYLRAWCSDRLSERLFRVDRMRDIRETTPLVDAPQSTATTALYTPAEDAVRVQVVLQTDRTDVLRPFDAELLTDEKGETQATVLLAQPDRAARLSATAPGLIEVLSPQTAREAVFEWANRALAQYDA